ncbi:hypothetical protein SEA_EVY_201 [Streptomyces phage Evy]|uniref:Uncharacterized protein n=2 Tax=Samistivirus TaxID=2560220 RepID=A0A0A0RTB3_9CAUD|nr:hypothetical protein AXJ18_gp105 [Streptomyces phage Jay2Jay]YP_010103545.1 hypothetical protein KNU67_gp096 [Streptomyces phage Evy]AIW02669.1 hypothetical protein PBI_JAY2JAY_215 [Streptomyces phage Jay2Jay]QDH94036.1 hypothetical protein SEA_EVY_201 [Streptomyces phage Evy]
MKKKWIAPGTRLMDRAYMRDRSGNVHTGEALLLALLLHAKGRTKRSQDELTDVSKIMKDRNLPKEKRGAGRRTQARKLS